MAPRRLPGHLTNLNQFNPVELLVETGFFALAVRFGTTRVEIVTKEYYRFMSWLKTAFVLFREAVGTEAGREVISNVRSAIRKDPSPSPPISLDEVEALVAEYRGQMNSSFETLINELNVQNQKLTESVRRQRVWNIALAVGLVVAVLVAFLT